MFIIFFIKCCSTINALNFFFLGQSKELLLPNLLVIAFLFCIQGIYQAMSFQEELMRLMRSLIEEEQIHNCCKICHHLQIHI